MAKSDQPSVPDMISEFRLSRMGQHWVRLYAPLTLQVGAVLHYYAKMVEKHGLVPRWRVTVRYIHGYWHSGYVMRQEWPGPGGQLMAKLVLQESSRSGFRPAIQTEYIDRILHSNAKYGGAIAGNRVSPVLARDKANAYLQDHGYPTTFAIDDRRSRSAMKGVRTRRRNAKAATVVETHGRQFRKIRLDADDKVTAGATKLSNGQAATD